MKKQMLVMVLVAVLCGVAGATTVGGVDQIWNSGGWQTQRMNNGWDTAYKAIAADRVQNARYYAAKPDSGIDTIWYSGGWQRVSTVSTTVKYNAIATTHYQYSMFAARSTGGIDQVWESGGWQSATKIASSTVYVSLAFDKVGTTSWRGYAAKENGGLDTYWYGGDSIGWQIQSYNANDTAKYNALAAKADDQYNLFAAAALGGIYEIDIDGSTSKTLLSGTAGIVYTSLATDSYEGSYGYKWIYGTRTNGAVDKIEKNGDGTFTVTTIVTDPMYIGLATHRQYGQNMVGIQIPEPATFALLGLGSMLFYRKK